MQTATPPDRHPDEKKRDVARELLRRGAGNREVTEELQAQFGSGLGCAMLRELRIEVGARVRKNPPSGRASLPEELLVLLRRSAEVMRKHQFETVTVGADGGFTFTRTTVCQGSLFG